MELKVVKIEAPRNCNLILGQSHFIKTVEDIHESVVTAVPGAKFGLAFCESSGPCLVRLSGTDDELKKLAAEAASKIGCGHCFIVFMRDFYPINILNRIKEVPEVCSVFCSTANPVEIIVAETDQGRGILGVIDGSMPRGIETEKDIRERKELLRKIGYKL
ncbi:MAG: adenosine-specific kinase [Candidatus Atabeyarchaeum deiterrae]